MSSEQFSSTPLPPEELRCPDCDARISPGAERCWLCGADLSKTGITAHPESAVPAPASETNLASKVFLTVLIGLITLGLGVVAPGLLVIGAIIAVPILIHEKTRKSSDRPTTVVGTILSSVAIALLVAIASFAAFFATCFAICLGGLALEDMNRSGGRGHNYDWVWIPSIGGGLAVGIFVGFILIRHFLRRRS